MNIQKAFDECVADLALALNTENTYTFGLKQFARFLAEINIDASEEVKKLEVDHFISFLSWLDKKYKKGTASVYSSSAKALLDYLVITNQIEISYLDAVRLKKATVRSHRRHEERLPRFPQKDDVPRMLAAVHQQVEVSPIKERNIAILEFLASSGCRVSEATGLNVQDIDIQNRSTVVTGKGSKERRVFFSPSAADAFESYWEARKSRKATDPAFARHDRGAGKKRIKRMDAGTVWNIVKAIADLAGIDRTKFTTHYFRHAFAIKVLGETGNIALAQDLLGHQDPKSTRVYAKIHSEDLREAHRQLFKN